MTEGYIFTLCVSPHLDGGGGPDPALDGGGVPDPALEGGEGVPNPALDWRVPDPALDWEGGSQSSLGQGGNPTLDRGYPISGYPPPSKGKNF